MFKQRLLTTLVLVPLVLLLIYYVNSSIFATAILLLVIACGWEWLQLIPAQQRLMQIANIVILLVTSILIHYFFYNIGLIVGLALWLLIALAVLTFPVSMHWWGKPGLVALLSWLLLPLFGQSLLNIIQMENGRSYLIYLLALVWSADIGAYLAGKQWGKHKLIPKVSPGKTWQGLVGGLVLTAITALIGYYYFRPQSLMAWLMMMLLIFVIALVGDLLISMLKRRVNVKDTGHLLPGHGGVLDRLDSLIAAAPAFYFASQSINFGTITWFLP